MKSRFSSFEEFWPHYVREHSKPETRRWHFLGVSLGLACVAGAVLTRQRWLALVAPVVGLAPGVLSHLLIEKNAPLYEHPLWSARADLLMWQKMLDGTMDEEVERAFAVRPRPAADPGVNMRTDGTLH